MTKKKVELVTLHRVKNYGSVLQAYATQEIVKSLGYDIEIINYYPERYTKVGMLKRVKNQNKYLKKSMILRTIARLFILPSYIVRFKTFDNFVKKYLNVTDKVYKTIDDVNDNIPYGDIYMTGSDQVWNYGWNGMYDRVLFLDFKNINEKLKIAYAASFGKSKLDDFEIDTTRDLLKKYDFISLREQSGVNICNDLGIKNTINVLDPTLLLNSDDWNKISSNKFDNEKYILVYNLNRNNKIDNYAKNLSQKTGLKIKYLSYQLHDFYKEGKMYCNPKVEDFLGLIKNATYIISDSFHATAFSLNFNKQFVIIYPGKYSTRLQNILKLLGLEDRVAKDENDLDIVKHDIDYKNVNKLLNEERKKSIEWLKEKLNYNNEKKNILYKDERDCSACGACMNICPVGAISMKKNAEGFIYPFVDQEKCIKCGLCHKVCAYQNNNIDGEPIKTYAAVTKNIKILESSASGGIFASLAKLFIEDNGVVYGCSMEKENNILTPKHIRIKNIDEIYKLQGSKYAKSVIDYIYKDIKKDLKDNLKVLFSGTPCQVAALKQYLKVTNTSINNLYTIDLICHGIPSTKMFQDYIKFEEEKVNGKITELKFRDKSNNWRLRGTIKYLNANKEEKQKNLYSRLSTYYKMFLYGEIYRSNCYSCKYTNKHRIGDITIGDFWGIEEEHPEYLDSNNGEFSKNKGISCIIVNSKNGEKLLEKYGKNISLKISDYDKVAKHNKQLNSPSVEPKSREKIMNLYSNNGYKSVDKYVKKKQGIKRILYYIYYKLNIK